ncbi:MAG: hypothetical protein OHK0022_18550 [Roseiflexaceae bacterium]
MSKQTPSSAPATQPQRQPSEPQEQCQPAQEASGPTVAGAPSGRLRPGELRALQGAAGNQAVQRMLGGRGRRAPERVAPAYQLGPVWRNAEQPALFHKPPVKRTHTPQWQIPVAPGGGAGVVQRVLLWSANKQPLTTVELKDLFAVQPDAKGKEAPGTIYLVTPQDNGTFNIQGPVGQSAASAMAVEDDSDGEEDEKSSSAQVPLNARSDMWIPVDDVDFDLIDDIGSKQVGGYLDKVNVVCVQIDIVSGNEKRPRKSNICHLPESVKKLLYEESEWFLTPEGMYAAEVFDGTQKYKVIFPLGFKNGIDVANIVYALYLHEIREPQPRSGKSRAASNDLKNTKRNPAGSEAAYAGAKFGFEDKKADIKINNSQFTAARIDATTIRASIVHKGPWGKGSRDAGQSAVMGNQNAKNYAIDVLHNNLDSNGKDKQRGKMGRWEWLHLIGSSLGGLNTVDNLVAGTYDANTKMIPLEHRVARWGAVGYNNEFKPTEQKPITIISTAKVYPNTHLAESIQVRVLHGTTEVASGDYKANEDTVLTKDQYDAEQARVDAQIEAARTLLAGTALVAVPQPATTGASSSTMLAPSIVPGPVPAVTGMLPSSGSTSPFPLSGSMSGSGPTVASSLSSQAQSTDRELKQPNWPFQSSHAFMAAQPVPTASGMSLSSSGLAFKASGAPNGSMMAAPPQSMTPVPLQSQPSLSMMPVGTVLPQPALSPQGPMGRNPMPQPAPGPPQPGLIGLNPMQQSTSGASRPSSHTAPPPDGDINMG